MIKANVKVNMKPAIKAINGIAKKDVPISAFYARKNGVRDAMKVGRDAVVGSLDRRVSKKFLPIKGAGQKNSHARFIGIYGTKDKARAEVIFNSNHINPAGTNKYPRYGTQIKTKLKSGRVKSRVKGIGGTYKDAFFIKTHRGAKNYPQVFERPSKQGVEQVVIELGKKAESVFRTAGLRGFKLAYEKEFNKQIKQRISRRVAR
jgi:hypothetical protein